MEQQQAQQIEQQLRQNWRQIRYRILDQFAQVSPADLDSAINVNDLVQRIADKTHHSERYVETKMLELAGVAAGQGGQGMSMGMPMGQQGMPMGQQGMPMGQQGGQAGSQGQPFGGRAST
jgi:hypothetical protein